MPDTFLTVLDRYRGLGPGFDFLRIVLATSIVFTHAFLLSGNGEFLKSTPLWFTEYALVPMFFALSGFLIAGSAQRLSLKNFLINRGLRIVPALAVDIFICALVIGPLMTTLPLGDYFRGDEFYKYFLNIIGWIHYELPGVFKNHPKDKVNDALWTVPWEIFCYVFMSALMLSKLISTRYKLLFVAIAYIGLGFVTQKMPYLLPVEIKMAFRFMFLSRGAQLVAAFLLGIVAYQFRSQVPYSKIMALVCGAICLAAVFLLDDRSIYSVLNRPILLPALVYLTVFIGLTPIPMPAFLKRGDYSYGVYLYHDPFLQMWISFFPAWFLFHASGAVFLFAVGLPSAFAVAVVSWHFIEKPILGLRKKFSFVAKARGVQGA